MITDPDVEAFCVNIVSGMSRCDAAKAAGRQKMWGTRMMGKPAVQARIAVLKTTGTPTYWQPRTIPDGPKVLSEIMRVYENAGKDADKLKALELLGRYRALFIDKTENQTTIDYDPKDFFKLEVVTKCELPKNNAGSSSPPPAP